MTTISVTVNGRAVSAEVEPRTHLADFLRDQLRLTGTHLGCEHGVCGACTVLIDGVPARSCITYAVACDGLEVRTIEGFEDDAVMAELREAFSREHGLQCGFCTAGMLISARDIVQRLPGADERRIRTELSGNLCRCTGYVGIVNAVKSVTARARPNAAPSPSPSQRSAPGPSLSHSVGEGRKSPSPALGWEREGPAAKQRESEGERASEPTREGWT
ncbi:MAG TPA: (2Fe-2S)-binding protein, partial [Stellaceae bacterium]|nr:(2Fe-2S)-binding protein [Stellaceae bacterium]